MPVIQFSDNRNAALKAAAPIGTFIGQLLFGWLADRAGRKRMCACRKPFHFLCRVTDLRADGIELIIIIIATFGQAMTANDTLGTVDIVWALFIWRFIVSVVVLHRVYHANMLTPCIQLGLGVGGDYPLSAVISSEFSATHIRGRIMTAVFANRGWGQFCKPHHEPAIDFPLTYMDVQAQASSAASSCLLSAAATTTSMVRPTARCTRASTARGGCSSDWAPCPRPSRSTSG